jgi:hypothetical protein
MAVVPGLSSRRLGAEDALAIRAGTRPSGPRSCGCSARWDTAGSPWTPWPKRPGSARPPSTDAGGRQGVNFQPSSTGKPRQGAFDDPTIVASSCTDAG